MVVSFLACVKQKYPGLGLKALYMKNRLPARKNFYTIASLINEEKFSMFANQGTQNHQYRSM